MDWVHTNRKGIAVKNKLPEEGVEYTFVFPGNRRITYVYVGLNDKKRVVLMNVNTKLFTTMTPGWFSKLRNRQLISTKRLADAPEEQKIVAPKEETLSEFDNRVLNELRSLTPAQSFAVEARIGRSVQTLISDLIKASQDNGEPYTQSFIDKTFSDLIKARDVYLQVSSNNLFN